MSVLRNVRFQVHHVRGGLHCLQIDFLWILDFLSNYLYYLCHIIFVSLVSVVWKFPNRDTSPFRKAIGHIVMKICTMYCKCVICSHESCSTVCSSNGWFRGKASRSHLAERLEYHTNVEHVGRVWRQIALKKVYYVTQVACNAIITLP